MSGQVALDKILFMDIETVSAAPDWDALGETERELWRKKSQYWVRDLDQPGDEDYGRTYMDKAAIYAEFGRIIVISAGFLSKTSSGYRMRIKSYIGETEKQLLASFAGMLEEYYPKPGEYGICGHNIKEFDVPYICRRMLIDDVPIPTILQVRGKKPWEVGHLIDTMDLWKFGDLKNYTSLDLLAHTLGIPSPKDDIDGSQVGRVYHEEHDLDRIKRYCEKDVLTVAQVYLRLNQFTQLKEDQIEFIP